MQCYFVCVVAYICMYIISVYIRCKHEIKTGCLDMQRRWFLLSRLPLKLYLLNQLSKNQHPHAF